jgi:hypothetical protein
MEPLPKELLDKELLELEQQLRSLMPAMPQTSPEQMLYQAGWEAALAQQPGTVITTANSMAPAKPHHHSAVPYLTAACAALLLLSAALAWQVWQQPQAGISVPITTAPANPREGAPAAAPSSAIAEPLYANIAPTFGAQQAAGLLNYLELRERVTRGGLSMWPTSTPAPVDPSHSTAGPSRDWQEELFRETL